MTRFEVDDEYAEQFEVHTVGAGYHRELWVLLACYIYPKPQGMEYTEEDLRNPDKVIELFGYCGILEALITKQGWHFLIELYGYEKLCEMDREALWCDSESIEEYMDWITYEVETSPEC